MKNDDEKYEKHQDSGKSMTKNITAHQHDSLDWTRHFTWQLTTMSGEDGSLDTANSRTNDKTMPRFIHVQKVNPENPKCNQ